MTQTRHYLHFMIFRRTISYMHANSYLAFSVFFFFNNNFCIIMFNSSIPIYQYSTPRYVNENYCSFGCTSIPSCFLCDWLVLIFALEHHFFGLPLCINFFIASVGFPCVDLIFSGLWRCQQFWFVSNTLLVEIRLWFLFVISPLTMFHLSMLEYVI